MRDIIGVMMPELMVTVIRVRFSNLFHASGFSSQGHSLFVVLYC